MSWKLFNIAAITSSGGTWSTQIQGNNLTFEDAKAVLEREVKHRLARPAVFGRIVMAVIADTENSNTTQQWLPVLVNALTGEIVA